MCVLFLLFLLVHRPGQRLQVLDQADQGGCSGQHIPGPSLWRGPSLTTIVDKGLLHFDWILVD